IGAWPRKSRSDRHASQRDQTRLELDFERLFAKVAAHYIEYALADMARLPVFLRLVVMEKPKADLRMGQRDAFERVHAMAVLGGFCTQKFSPCGDVAEYLPDVYRGAHRAGRRFRVGRVGA